MSLDATAGRPGDAPSASLKRFSLGWAFVRTVSWIMSAPVTATVLLYLCAILSVGAFLAWDRYADLLRWGDNNSRTVARSIGMVDAINVLASLADAEGPWKLTQSADGLLVGKGEATAMPLNARVARLVDGSGQEMVSYTMAERDGVPVVVAATKGATSYACMLIAGQFGSPYTRRRLEIGVSTAASPRVTWMPVASQRPAILRACAGLPETVPEATPYDAVLVRYLAGDAALSLEGDGADARQFHARSRDRAGDGVAVDERHFCSMHRSRDGLLDHRVPARPASLKAGDEACHVLIGCDRGKADPDAEAEQARREHGTLLLAGKGSDEPLNKTSMHENSPGRRPTPTEGSPCPVNLDGALTGRPTSG